MSGILHSTPEPDAAARTSALDFAYWALLQTNPEFADISDTNEFTGIQLVRGAASYAGLSLPDDIDLIRESLVPITLEECLRIRGSILATETDVYVSLGDRRSDDTGGRIIIPQDDSYVVIPVDSAQFDALPFDIYGKLPGLEYAS